MDSALLKDRRVKIVLWVLGAIILGFWANAAWVQKVRILDNNIQTSFNQFKHNLNVRAQFLPEFIVLVKNYAPQEQTLIQELSTSYEYSQRYQLPIQMLTQPKLAAEYTQLQRSIVNSVEHLAKVAQSNPNLGKNRQYFLLLNQWVEFSIVVVNNERALNNNILLYNSKLTGFPEKWYNRLVYRFPIKIPTDLANYKR